MLLAQSTTEDYIRADAVCERTLQPRTTWGDGERGGGWGGREEAAGARRPQQRPCRTAIGADAVAVTEPDYNGYRAQ